MSCTFKESKKVRGGQSAREDAQSSHRENLFFLYQYWIILKLVSCWISLLKAKSKE